MFGHRIIILILLIQNDNSNSKLVKTMNDSTQRKFLNEQMLKQFEAIGMRPAHQARSRELVVRLFNEGLALLHQVDFDGLAIEELCARSDSTVGAFYSRFENKEAFINALQRLVVTVTREATIANYESDVVVPRDSLDHLVTWITKGSLAWHQRYEGLIRASLRRANSDSDMWTPLRELGELHISYALPRILGFLPPSSRNGAEERVHFAFQMLFGTLNNLVLINPGPFTIHQPQTAHMLASAMVAFIQTQS